MRALRFKLNITEIADLYVNQKWGKEAIAKKFGVSSSVIHKRLLNNGIKLRTRQEVAQLSSGKVFDSDLPEIVRLYQEGYTLEETAMKYKVSHEIIAKHLRRLGKIRTPEETKAVRGTISSGSKNPRWQGGKWENSDGYIEVYKPNHPRAKNHNYILEHILVWEEYHQKKLPQGWVIHHLNGIKNDNRSNNLVALPNHKHKLILAEKAKKIRELEIENRQLRRALEDSQSIFYISDN